MTGRPTVYIIDISIIIIIIIINDDIRRDDVTMTTLPDTDGLNGWPPLTVWLTGLILGEQSSVELRGFHT